MFPKALLLSVFVWLLIAPAVQAHEPCGGYARSPAPSCQVSCGSARSPFRLIHLRTIRIYSTSSLPDGVGSISRYGQLLRPIDCPSCHVYQEIEK